MRSILRAKFEIWKGIAPLREECPGQLVSCEESDDLVELESSVVAAAQHWIDEDKLMPLLFALADRAARSGEDEACAGDERCQPFCRYGGFADRLERLRDEHGWDWVCDDDYDEPLEALVELALASGCGELANFAWVTDEILEDAVRRHEEIINELRTCDV